MLLEKTISNYVQVQFITLKLKFSILFLRSKLTIFSMQT